jgi:LmbE family N-acetylglucosaminyl deacetylase
MQLQSVLVPDMSTLVTVHAHPDDEAIACGGTIAKAAKEGHRVVIVFATRGEHGEVAEGFLEPGEELAARREVEARRAAEMLGAHRVEFLGYRDSGMMGTPENNSPGSFWSADVTEAAERLARILQDERADVVTIYDSNGTYGHPDHIQVYRVGVRAAEIAGTKRVYESVANRDRIQQLMSKLAETGVSPPIDPEAEGLGVPESIITTFVDVEDFAELKRAAMAAHASQIPENSFFLSLPDELHREVFGTEHYVLRGAPADLRETDLFAD